MKIRKIFAGIKFRSMCIAAAPSMPVYDTMALHFPGEAAFYHMGCKNLPWRKAMGGLLFRSGDQRNPVSLSP